MTLLHKKPDTYTAIQYTGTFESIQELRAKTSVNWTEPEQPEDENAPAPTYGTINVYDESRGYVPAEEGQYIVFPPIGMSDLDICSEEDIAEKYTLVS